MSILRVVVKSGVFAPELGRGLVNCFHLENISEFYPGNHLSMANRIDPVLAIKIDPPQCEVILHTGFLF